MDESICLFSPYCRHTSQGIVLKEGKDPRVVWDGTTKSAPHFVVMNDITTVDDEAPITFGEVKMAFYVYIYNLRVTYPLEVILLALADVKACFRFPRIHPDLTGAFGFLADGFYNLATAMVFGSNASATSWEPFRRAIEALTAVYVERDDLVAKHRDFLDMVSWDTDVPAPKDIAQAYPCDINKGVHHQSKLGAEKKMRPARMYVDDALLAAFNRRSMEKLLAAIIEAIFTVMGDSCPTIRQCPLAMNKWKELVVGPRQIVLGLVIDTNRLTISPTPEFIQEVRLLLDKTWHPHRRRFTVMDAQCLVGKLARLAEGAYWVFHLLSHLYTSIASALAANRAFLEESSEEF